MPDSEHFTVSILVTRTTHEVIGARRAGGGKSYNEPVVPVDERKVDELLRLSVRADSYPEALDKAGRILDNERHPVHTGRLAELAGSPVQDTPAKDRAKIVATESIARPYYGRPVRDEPQA